MLGLSFGGRCTVPAYGFLLKALSLGAIRGETAQVPMSRRPSTPSEVPDADIVCLLRIGDPKGLTQLLDKHGGKVMWNLRRELGTLFPEPDLEAALNQAAYQAWTHASTHRARWATRASRAS